MQIGKTVEELEVGMSGSLTRTITKEDVENFAEISGDKNPVHMDEEYAKTTVFGRRVAHGAFSLGIVSALLGTKFPGLGTIALEISTKFLKPVHFDDTVTVTATVTKIYAKRNLVRLDLLWKNQRDEEISRGETLVMVPSKQ